MAATKGRIYYVDCNACQYESEVSDSIGGKLEEKGEVCCPNCGEPQKIE